MWHRAPPPSSQSRGLNAGIGLSPAQTTSHLAMPAHIATASDTLARRRSRAPDPGLRRKIPGENRPAQSVTRLNPAPRGPD
ncbi:hypothetical protein [Lysobacter gummosus]|uniref:hypothetical protein n=1 Tax=Lysobacter gummosus TaxID=262324 RepID=UPI00363C3AAD